MVAAHCGIGANLSPRAVWELGVPHMQKRPIFRLWGPAPTPIFGETPKRLLFLYLHISLRVPAKFGGDRPVNKALPQWGYRELDCAKDFTFIGVSFFIWRAEPA
jgi:hypothetical protein